ncbi:MAG: CopD family protein [Flavobacteriales bacterium]|nr:CopD family protein [Flavobacteriales bacterium]
MFPLVLKSLHIIFMVTWFAGLFYIVRLFIYWVEAGEKDDVEKKVLQNQFRIMQRRLWYGITWPGMILTTIFGFWMVHVYNYWKMPWLHLKLAFVGLLYGYHFICHRFFLKIQKGKFSGSSLKLRIWNEAATILLFVIVFAVVFKDQLSKIWGGLGILILSLCLLIAIYIYKKKRSK